MSRELKQQVLDQIRSDIKDSDGMTNEFLSDLVTNRLSLYKEYGISQCRDELVSEDYVALQNYYSFHGRDCPEDLESLSDDDIIDLYDSDIVVADVADNRNRAHEHRRLDRLG